MRIHFTRVSFDEGIHLLQGKKIIPDPGVSVDMCFHCEPPKDYRPEVTYFDDGTCMSLVSDWYEDYYGEIDARRPLFLYGTVEE